MYSENLYHAYVQLLRRLVKHFPIKCEHWLLNVLTIIYIHFILRHGGLYEGKAVAWDNVVLLDLAPAAVAGPGPQVPPAALPLLS